VPRQKHLTDHTAGEVQAIFESLIGTIGGTYDASFGQRVLGIPIDGVRLGDRRNEMQKPDSTFYGKEYIEALSVARMLVSLDLDGTVTNLERRDSPDVAVHFSDRPQLYVEQTLLQELDGMTFARHLDELNRAIATHSASDASFAKFCDDGFFSVRLTDPGMGKRSRPELTAYQIADLAASIGGEVSLFKPDGTSYPALAPYAPNVFYRPGRGPNGMICNQDAGVYDPHASWIPARLRNALNGKRAKANAYDPNLRPLWLLVDLDAERGIYVPFARPTIENALAGLEISPYDRVVVSMPGAAPVFQ
jgi:hypothetical protein